jgi:hypothetical protein
MQVEISNLVRPSFLGRVKTEKLRLSVAEKNGAGNIACTSANPCASVIPVRAQRELELLQWLLRLPQLLRSVFFGFGIYLLENSVARLGSLELVS